MDETQLAIARVMLIGVVVSLTLVFVGGILDLIYSGNQIIDYHTFHGLTPQHMVFNSARGLIKLGIFALVLTQVLRVAIAGWFFAKLKEYIFVWISIFIVVVMLVSLVWHS